MKKNSLKKILISGALVGIMFGISACATKTSETNVVKTNSQGGIMSETEATSDTQPTLKTTSTPDAIINKDVQSTSSTKVEEKTTNKINTNTIMNPEQQEDLTKTYSQAILKTSLGNITVKFYAAESPITVNNFLNLAKAGFYNGTKFHRVIKDFMIQGGDPLSKEANASVWGTGGPDYRFKDEFNDHKLVAGSLAMANSGANTNGSQFFIVTAAETSWLDGKHTNFGYVVGGMDVVKKIEAVQTGAYDRPLENVVVSSVELVK